MCGRLFQTRAPARLAELFGTTNPLVNTAPRYNVAPGDEILAVRRNPETGERALGPLRWGLVPRWADDPKIGYNMINARSESLTEKPAFRDAFARRRCLVPADGFFEWQAPEGGGKGPKQPFAIAMAADETGERPVLAFAALWEGWRSPAGEILRTVTIVTTEANALLAPLHHRMPVILGPEDWASWLGDAPANDASLKVLMRPFPAAALDLWPVSPAVGNVRNQEPGLIEPISPAAGMLL